MLSLLRSTRKVGILELALQHAALDRGTHGHGFVRVHVAAPHCQRGITRLRGRPCVGGTNVAYATRLLHQVLDSIVIVRSSGAGSDEVNNTSIVEILDPNREVQPVYVQYVVTDVRGGIATGLIVAAPMSSIDKLTVISTDGAGQLPKQVTSNIVQTMELMKNATGVDLEGLIQGYVHRSSADGSGQGVASGSKADA